MVRTLFLLLLFSASVWSQKPEVVSVEKLDRTFKGFVGEYPITMSLEVHTISNRHDSIYSVKGWYWYDRKEIKIPLVGVYDGGLTLYSFANKENEAEILSVGNDWGVSVWETIDLIRESESFDFTEHFSFGDAPDSKGEIRGFWQNAESELEAKIIDNDLAILSRQEFLAFPDDDIVPIDLYKHDIFATGFTFESWHKDKDGIRVLLRYSYRSNANALGMCGGANESGFVVLNLDKDYRFVSSEKIPIESCLDSLYAEIDGKNSDIYTVTGSDRKKTRLRVDRKNAKIIKL